jgi:hydrogenase expression/formation protein HypC
MCLGIPGRITEIGAGEAATSLRMASVDFGGIQRQVCLVYTPEADVGDYVIVHVGFAISRVDEKEAERTLAVIRSIPQALEIELGPESAAVKEFS